jgi:predicted nucleic acid-binding protein
LSRSYLIDSNVYIRGFRESAFGSELQSFHRTHLPHLVMSAVVLSELLVGAQRPERDRTIRRTLLDPFRARRRLVTPAWSTWDLATKIDRRLRRTSANRNRLARRSFFQDILIAAAAREAGATIITYNIADFTLISRHVDITFVTPWPATLAV